MCHFACGLLLRVSDVFLAEQELTIQIAHLDVVVVGTVYFSLRCTAHTHKSECFDEFAAESASSNQEGFDFTKFFLKFTSKNLNLVVVSRIGRRAVNLALWNGLKNVVVYPLFQWAVLPGVLNDFLRDDSAEECGLGTN